MKYKDITGAAIPKMTDTQIDNALLDNKIICSKCASSVMHCNRHEAKPKREPGLPPLPTPRAGPRNKAIEVLKCDRSFNALRKTLTRVGSCPDIVQGSGRSNRSVGTSPSNTVSDISPTNSPPVSANKRGLHRAKNMSPSNFSPSASPLARRKHLNEAKDLNRPKSNSKAESLGSCHSENAINAEDSTRHTEHSTENVSIEKLSFDDKPQRKSQIRARNGMPQSPLSSRKLRPRQPLIQTSRSGSCPNLLKRMIHRESSSAKFKQDVPNVASDYEILPDGLSQMTFERCKEWLLGVEQAKESKTLSDATVVPPVHWDDS